MAKQCKFFARFAVVFPLQPDTIGGWAVSDIVYWKDPRISGAILAAGLIFFYVTTRGGYSYLTLFSIIIMMHLLVSILHGVVSSYQGSTPPTYVQPEIEL